MADGLLPHKLSLNERKALNITGVSEVLRFDDTSVVLRTSMGTLMVHGNQLQLKTLSLDGGQVSVDGTISALVYEEPRASGSWLSRLLG